MDLLYIAIDWVTLENRLIPEMFNQKLLNNSTYFYHLWTNLTKTRRWKYFFTLKKNMLFERFVSTWSDYNASPT